MDTTKVDIAIEQSLLQFQERRKSRLETVGARNLLRRKNPYLFAAMGVEDVDRLAAGLLDAFLSSSEETILGNAFFEPIARAACGGAKSSADGIDIEVASDRGLKVIAVKSGTSVFNAASKKKQNDNFVSVLRRHGGTDTNVDCIVGYAYGKKSGSRKSQFVFREIAGRVFWAEMSGNPDFHDYLFQKIKTGHGRYAEKYELAKQETLARLTQELSEAIGRADGTIDWECFLRMNSG